MKSKKKPTGRPEAKRELKRDKCLRLSIAEQMLITSMLDSYRPATSQEGTIIHALKPRVNNLYG